MLPFDHGDYMLKMNLFCPLPCRIAILLRLKRKDLALWLSKARRGSVADSERIGTLLLKTSVRQDDRDTKSLELFRRFHITPNILVWRQKISRNSDYKQHL